jgi:hypothetical protein
MGSIGGPAGNGPVTASQAVTLYENGTTAYSPALTATYSFSNQQYGPGTVESLPTNSALSFGGNLNTVNSPMGAVTLYSLMNSIGGATNTMFTAANTFSSGTEINVTSDKAISFFSCTDALITASTINLRPLNDRVYFGDLTITFNRPVSNPVLQIVGLGGTLTFSRLGKNYDMGFTTEFDLQGSNVSLTKLSGNTQLNVSATQINNSATWFGPVSTGTSSNGITRYAASGSVLVNGTNITSVRLKMYVRGDGGRVNNGSTVVAASAGINPVWSVGAVNSQGLGNGNVSGDGFLIGVAIKKPCNITGNVFNDANALNVNSTSATNVIANGIYANLTDAAGKIVATVPVNTNGTYSFLAVSEGTYTVSISTTAGVQAADAPQVVMPAGWINTGEFNGAANAGIDATIDGKSAAFTVAAVDISNINFGIERLPESNDQSYTVLRMPVNTFIVLNGSGSLANPGPLTGSDAEDMPASGSLAGKKIAITKLPTNSQLWYNNAQVKFGADGINVPSVNNPFVITNYNIALLKIKIVTATMTALNTSFDYAYIDAANKMDSTPANYILNWPLVLAAQELKLTAALSYNKVTLSWTTLSETNTAYFEVERSTANMQFVKTGSNVTASGNSTVQKAYNFNEDISTLAAGTIYYRVKLFNNDGSISYSNIVTVNFKNIDIKLWPNPFAESVQVNINAQSKGTVEIRVNDVNGRTLKIMQQQIAAGNNQITMKGLTQLTNGTYFLQVIIQSEEAVAFKLFKQ